MNDFLNLEHAGEATGLLAMEDSAMESSYPFEQSPDLSRQNSNTSFVSPQDTYYSSEPPSGTFTNLSTPNGIFDSPDWHLADDSPLFGHGDNDESFGFETMSMFPPLYPSKDRHDEPVTLGLNESYNIETIAASALEAPAMSRNASSSPGKAPTRSSQQGRITKTKRATKELDPIKVKNPDDPIEVKRARNTAAARKSRQRKSEYATELEDSNRALSSEVDALRAELAQARAILDRNHLS